MEGYQIKSDILESLNNEINAINTKLLDSLKGKKDVICTEEFVKICFSSNIVLLNLLFLNLLRSNLLCLNLIRLNLLRLNLLHLNLIFLNILRLNLLLLNLFFANLI